MSRHQSDAHQPSVQCGPYWLVGARAAFLQTADGISADPSVPGDQGVLQAGRAER